MITTKASFSIDQLEHIEALRRDLAATIGADVVIEYGSADNGEGWAALVVESVPEGASGSPGVLVSLVTHGEASGALGVMAADGRAIDWAEAPEAMETAKASALIAWGSLIE